MTGISRRRRANAQTSSVGERHAEIRLIQMILADYYIRPQGGDTPRHG